MLTGAVSPRGRRAGGAASKLAPCVALELSQGCLSSWCGPSLQEREPGGSHMFVCPNLGRQHCVLHERVTEEGPLSGREAGLSLGNHGTGGGP